MDLVVYDDDEKRYVPWAVALTALLLVALVTAGLTFLLASLASGDEAEQAVSGRSAPEAATAPSEVPTTDATTSPSPTPSPACAAVLRRADAALRQSAAVEQALADHTAIADELLAGRITAQQALDRTLPVLTAGATERQRLDEAIAAYQQSREDCPA